MSILKQLLFTKQESRAAAMASTLFGGAAGTAAMFSAGDLKFKDAVSRGYKGIVWIHRCISELAQGVGSVPWKVYQQNDDLSVTPIPGHPLERLLQRPNPYFDRSEFFGAWITYLSLSGNTYWEKVFVKSQDPKMGGRIVPKYLYHIRPDWMIPVPDPKAYLKGYKMDPGTGKESDRQTFDPTSIVHFKYLDPMNEFVGMSPLTAASRTMDTENAAIGWNKALLDNYGVPGGILEIPAQTLLVEDRKALQEEIDKEFTGDNRFRPLVLWGGMKWDQMALSQKDMEFLEQRNLNKYELCAVYGVPGPLVGAVQDPTYSNYSVARLSFWEDTIIGLLDWLKTKINTQVAPYFGDGILADYDVSDVPAFRESFQQKVKTGVELVKAGWPLNAVNSRLRLGFEDVPWGDVAWMPGGMVPVAGGTQGTLEEEDEEPKPVGVLPNEDDDEDEEEDFGQEDDPTAGAGRGVGRRQRA